MLQKELAKRLRGRFETEPDGDAWLAVSSDGMPLCRVKYNGNCIVNDNPYLSEEYLGKIAEVQNDLLTVKEYLPPRVKRVVDEIVAQALWFLKRCIRMAKSLPYTRISRTKIRR